MTSQLKPLLLFGAVLLGVGILWKTQFSTIQNPDPRPALSALSPDAVWPWPNSQTREITNGISQTRATGKDGSRLEFYRFDFAKNPRLRFEIYDQDENDAKPLDNRTLFWEKNVGEAVSQLEKSGRGPIWVAWNGAFFGYDDKTPETDSFHVSPVVLNGKVHFNTANHRWVWGVKNTPSGPRWSAIHKPSRAQMEREFDFAAGSLQLLVRDGKPLKLEPFPANVEELKAQPVSSTPAEAGHIPIFDHMRTSRASLGWSRDHKTLFLLTVRDPNGEAASAAAWKQALRGNIAANDATTKGGWTVSDIQKFWLSQGAWGAVNSDAGDVLQTASRRANGQLEVAKPSGGGGAQMYFFVREGR